MKAKPLGNKLIVQRTAADETSKGGIFLPEQARTQNQYGIVRSVGPGILKDDGSRTHMEVNVGDKVLFGKYGGTEIEVDGEKLLLMKEEDLLAVLED